MQATLMGKKRELHHLLLFYLPTVLVTLTVEYLDIHDLLRSVATGGVKNLKDWLQDGQHMGGATLERIRSLAQQHQEFILLHHKMERFYDHLMIDYFLSLPHEKQILWLSGEDQNWNPHDELWTASSANRPVSKRTELFYVIMDNPDLSARKRKILGHSMNLVQEIKKRGSVLYRSTDPTHVCLFHQRFFEFLLHLPSEDLFLCFFV